MINTVEPRFNEVLRDWGNWFVISRVRYIENLDITNLRKNNQNVRCIEVQLIIGLFNGVTLRYPAFLDLLQYTFTRVSLVFKTRKTIFTGSAWRGESRTTRLKTHMCRRVWKLNPGHIGEKRVLSPQHHSCSPNRLVSNCAATKEQSRGSGE